jgi:ATP-dependent DNA helicase RecQ
VAEEAVEEGVIEAVRTVLSGVARSESRIACGKNLIAQMLCGSNSAKVKKLRLNQLSTFGLLWHLKQAEVATLIDLLIALGCLEQEEIDRFRPVLRLTPLGGDVMRGKAELPAGLRLPGELRLKLRRPTARVGQAFQPDKSGGELPAAGVGQADRDHDHDHDHDHEYMVPDMVPDTVPDTVPEPDRSGGELRRPAAKDAARSEVGDQRSEVRRQRSAPDASPPKIAQPSGQAPDLSEYEGPPEDDAWIIGSMPEGAAVGLPGDPIEAAEMAPAKAATRPPANAAVSPGQEEQTPSPVNRPSYYWTWRLLSQGFPAEECLAIRGITRETLLDHVFQAAENGLKIRSAWYLSADTITTLDALVGDHPPTQIRPLLAQLPAGTRYEEVQIYLKCRFS